MDQRAEQGSETAANRIAQLRCDHVASCYLCKARFTNCNNRLSARGRSPASISASQTLLRGHIWYGVSVWRRPLSLQKHTTGSRSFYFILHRAKEAKDVCPEYGAASQRAALVNAGCRRLTGENETAVAC